MDPEPIVFDISSDEESYCRMVDPRGDDYHWLAEILRVSGDGEKSSDDDSDDVVVLREVKAPEKSKSLKLAVRNENENDDDDDDCVVLDGDPDKPVVEDSELRSDSEDLLIVSEKGQIACRDYPHSRHLCATFSFSSTPHEKHCNLCHCYVCDKPSPCTYWVNTSSGIDHCDATDKDNKWKMMRRSFKSGKAPTTVQVPKLSQTTIPVGLPLRRINQVESLNIAQLCPNPRPPNYIPRPQIYNTRPSTTIQGCSSTNFSVPPILQRSRNSQYQASPHKNGIYSYVPSRLQINNPGGKGGQPISNIGPRYVPPIVTGGSTMFKRPGILRAPRPGVYGASLPVNQPTYNSPNNRGAGFHGQYPGPRYHAPAPTPTPAPVPMKLSKQNWDIAPNFVATPLRPIPPISQPIPPINIQSSYQPENPFQSSNQSLHPYANSGQNSGQNSSHEEVQSPGASSGSSGGYNPSWVNNAPNNASQSDNNRQQHPLVDHGQPQVVAELLNEPLAKESNTGFGVRNINSAERELENWLLDNPPSSLVAPNGPPTLQSNNLYSPESAYFDLITPWSDLTHHA